MSVMDWLLDTRIHSCLRLLHEMLQSLPRTCIHSPVYFMSALDYLYLVQYGYCVTSSYTMLFRE